VITFHDAPQGSEAWLEARKGKVTGSKFKHARGRLADKTDKETGKITRGEPNAKCILYAQDVARERMGGTAAGVFVNGAMRYGTEQEPLARAAYETTTGRLVREVGFATTACGTYGLSSDGLVDDDGCIEIKTMVGSDNLFTAVVDGDYSEYIDQCLGYLLFLDLQWVDLVLWTPDLEYSGLGLVIHRITRADKAAKIADLKADLETFADLVRKFESKLRIVAAGNAEKLLKAA